MKLFNFFRVMVFLTVVALIYIHLQMKIFDLAYQGKTNEKLIHNLRDENGELTYEILKLKSSQNLGGKLLTENSSLKFLDQSSVVPLKTTQISLAPKQTPRREEPAKAGLLAGLFLFRAQAEASR